MKVRKVEMISPDLIPQQAEPRGHYVQFYKADEALLNRNVGQYLWEGLLRGDGLLVIATPQRHESLTGHLRRSGVDVPTVLRERQLAILDAEHLLNQFMIGSEPDPNLFRHTIDEALRLVSPRGPDANVRTYGEMVGVLWQAGQFEAAIRVEECWNQVLHERGITLFCGYPIDVFSVDMFGEDIESLLCAHTHVVPSVLKGEVDKAVHQAMDDVFGAEAEELRLAITAKRPTSRPLLPASDNTIAWIRNNLPHQAADVLSRARSYYEAALQPPALQSAAE